MKKILIILALCSCVMFSGCKIRHGDFTTLSNKLIRLSDFELDTANRVPDVVGKEVQHIVIFIPIGSPPTLEGALDDALKGRGDLMTDAVVESWGFYIPYIYGQAGWSVSGDVVKTRKN